ncbi:MAG: CRISPR system precrRNA processing endoribonuclease RAMP protein Cas6 [Candidatus Thorarchaeota archaeon]|nr:MAG: hypothetical protein DRO87_08860 [Candidatus Thorarchaeota archaeon]RLI56454.1 MAG: hypothetical protein DRP09_06645 [Candidatus Thorarchaeota archaeon]
MMSLRFHLSSPATCVIGFSGVPLRAAFLNLLRSYDRDLSAQVHGEAGPRAYSIDPFRCNTRFQTHFEQGEEYDFGVNIFSPSRFQGMLRNIAMTRNHKMRILHYGFSLRRVDMQQMTAKSLMEQWLAERPDSGNRPLRMRFHFRTPTQFSSFGSDRAYLLPTPEKIFSSLLKVWRTMEQSVTVERSGAYRDWITENVFVSGHRLQTVRVPLGRGRSLMGFVGNVEYSMEPSDDPLANLTYCLARFAELSNIGKNRSAGFGKVEVEIGDRTMRDRKRVRRSSVFSAG